MTNAWISLARSAAIDRLGAEDEGDDPVSLEVLRQVRRANADARDRDHERERERQMAETNNGSATREGVPVEAWRTIWPEPEE